MPTLEQLALACDVAVRERDEAIRPSDEMLSRACRTVDAYFGALRDKSFELLRKIEHGPYSEIAENRAHYKAACARAQLRILADVGPDLRLMSEWLCAHAMEERFEMIGDEFALKRENLIDAKRAGTLKRTSAGPRVISRRRV